MEVEGVTDYMISMQESSATELLIAAKRTKEDLLEDKDDLISRLNEYRILEELNERLVEKTWKMMERHSRTLRGIEISAKARVSETSEPEKQAKEKEKYGANEKEYQDVRGSVTKLSMKEKYEANDKEYQDVRGNAIKLSRKYQKLKMDLQKKRSDFRITDDEQISIERIFEQNHRFDLKLGRNTAEEKSANINIHSEKRDDYEVEIYNFNSSSDVSESNHCFDLTLGRNTAKEKNTNINVHLDKRDNYEEEIYNFNSSPDFSE